MLDDDLPRHSAFPEGVRLPLLPAVTAAAPLDRARHLLGLSVDVAPEELETLASSRFPASYWEVAPEGVDLQSPPVRWARPGEPGVLRLGPTAAVVGPYAPRFSDGLGAGLPDDVAYVLEVVCTRERGDLPFVGAPDRDGVARAFPAGLPVGGEAAAVDWVVAAARRLAGAVRLDVGGPRSPELALAPDPDVNVDLTVYSDVWLEPEATLALVRSVLPGAVLGTEGVEWQGPPPVAYDPEVLGVRDLTREQLAALQLAADEVDMAALREGFVLEGYGVLADLGEDGMLAVAVGAEDAVPVVLTELPWTQGGALAYRVQWEPPDLAVSQLEHPPAAHLRARAAVLPLVAQVAALVQHAVGGEVADDDGFLVDPEDLL